METKTTPEVPEVGGIAEEKEKKILVIDDRVNFRGEFRNPKMAEELKRIFANEDFLP